MTTRSQAISRYWDQAAQGRLVYQFCPACKLAVFPPRGLCPYCWSDALVERVSLGYGTVYTYADDPTRATTFVLVELDEGFFMFATAVNGDRVDIGTRVVVTFARLADGRDGPVFRINPEDVNR